MQPGSYRDIERRTGIDKNMICLAEQHVAAVRPIPTSKQLRNPSRWRLALCRVGKPRHYTGSGSGSLHGEPP